MYQNPLQFIRWQNFLARFSSSLVAEINSVLDPHNFDVGPDADPDSTYHPDADPDSDFYLCGSGILFDADPTFHHDADPDPGSGSRS
jgi:hypothetical protein